MWAVLHKRKLSSSQIILFGFAGVILVGTLLLMLPFATRTGHSAPFGDALFTATSAVCVTGLIVQDTATYWSAFGQSVILLLIQIGGMGVITVAVAITMASGKKISLMQRSTMQDAISAPQVGGIVRFTGFILKGIFLFELLGALVLMTVFVPEYGVKGIWLAVFHSISAFCNAGFDIFGYLEPGTSLMLFNNDPVVLLTISALITLGGLGFFVWQEVVQVRKWNKLSVYTRLVLLTSGVLLLGGTVLFCLLEWNNPDTLGAMSLGDKLLNGLFQSVTLRTAGFAAIDQAKLTDAGKGISMLYMLVGGSSGSTAGGLKTVTFVVLFLFMAARARGRETVCVYKRTIPSGQVLDAMTIAFIMIVLAVFGGIFISATSPVGFTDALYEAVSALATVGLTAGVTGNLSIPAQILIIIYMYFGRVGVLTISMGFLAGNRAEERFRYAETKLLIG